MKKEAALQMLVNAGVFYYDNEEQWREFGDPEPDETFRYELNQNDTWGWACAFGQEVPEDKMSELGELFWRYGYGGVLYWVSEQNQKMRSEFFDINRQVDFVRREERFRKLVSGSSARAYTPTTWVEWLSKISRSIRAWRYFLRLWKWKLSARREHRSVN